MKHSKEVAILSPGLDPYKFIDECILLPWLFEKEEPDILWALCSRVPFIKQYSGKFRGILSNPNVINQMVDDDDNLVSNGDEDSSCAVFTTDEVDELIEFRNEYSETEQWKKSQNDIWQLFLPFCNPNMRKKIQQLLERNTEPKTCPIKICATHPLSKTNIKKYFQTRESRWKPRYKKSRIKFMGYVQGISSLVKDYKAIMQIKDRLYTKIGDLQQQPAGRMKLKYYFGDWKKTPAQRKNVLLQKLIAGMERSREWMNPAGYVGFIGDEPIKCRYRKNCKEKKCPTHPEYERSTPTRYKQSFREIPYILAKLGVFTKLQCKLKKPCDAVNCLSDRIKECASFDKDVADYCDFCPSRSKDICPFKNPCPKGQEKYKNARKKITAFSSLQ